jgi:hypothetical protein
MDIYAIYESGDSRPRSYWSTAAKATRRLNLYRRIGLIKKGFVAIHRLDTDGLKRGIHYDCKPKR